MRNSIPLANGRIAQRVVLAKPPTASGKPKLLDQLRHALRSRHYSRRTEQAFRWVKRFIFFHRVRHPKEMGEPEINAFLTQDLRPTKRLKADLLRRQLSRHTVRPVRMITKDGSKRIECAQNRV